MKCLRRYFVFAFLIFFIYLGHWVHQTFQILNVEVLTYISCMDTVKENPPSENSLTLIQVQETLHFGYLNMLVISGFITSFCWWKKSCTARNVKNSVNNGIDYQPQLVQEFFHQQYPTALLFIDLEGENEGLKIWKLPKPHRLGFAKDDTNLRLRHSSMGWLLS